MTAEKSCRAKLHFGNKKTFVDYSSTTRRLIPAFLIPVSFFGTEYSLNFSLNFSFVSTAFLLLRLYNIPSSVLTAYDLESTFSVTLALTHSLSLS